MPNASNSLMNYLRAIAGACRDDSRDDAELLARYADDHDEDAFRALAWRHGTMVWRTCQRILGATPDAEDAFQTVFLTLTRKASRLRRESLAGWLHRVARQAALDVDASARRRRGMEQKIQTNTQPKVKEDSGQIEQNRVLDEELAGLPEKLRVAIVLHFLEDKTQEEVARILGCTRCSVQRRLARGEAILRKRLEQRGLALGAGGIAALLRGTTDVATMPAGLIASTAQAAVAFRAGTLNGVAVDGTRKLLRSLSMEGAVRKFWWVVVAFVGTLGFCGAGLIAWKMIAEYSDVAKPVTPVITADGTPVTRPQDGRVDRYGDPLPEGAIARIGSMRFRVQGGRMQSGTKLQRWTALSGNNKILALASEDGSIEVWDVDKGKKLHRIVLTDEEKNQYHIEKRRIALSFDGKLLAVSLGFGDRDSIVLIEPSMLDGKMLSANMVQGRGTILVDPATGQQVGEQYAGCSPAFAPNGKVMAFITQSSSIAFYDIGKRKPMQTVKVGGAVDFSFVVFSRDSQSLAGVEWNGVISNVAEKGRVHLLDVKTGKATATLKGQGIEKLTFTPDGNVITAGKDNALRVWDAKSGKELRRLGVMDPVRTYSDRSILVDLLSDGKTIVAGCNEQIHFWDLSTGKEVRPAQSYKELINPVMLSSDGTLLIERIGNSVSIRDAKTGKETGVAAGAPRSLMEHLAFSPDGSMLVTAAEGKEELGSNWQLREPGMAALYLWEVATGKLLGSLMVPAETAIRGLKELAWPERDTVLATVLYGKDLAKWPSPGVIKWTNVAAGRITAKAEVCAGGAEFSPDGQVLVRSGQKGKGVQGYQLSETVTGKNISFVPCPKNPKGFEDCGMPNVHLIFSANHQILATQPEDRGTAWPITVWDTFTGRELYSIKMPDPTPRSGEGDSPTEQLIGLSPDSRLVVTQNSDPGNNADPGTREISLWERVSGRVRWHLPLPPECHDANVAFSPDGRLLAVGCVAGLKSERSIHVWDLVSEQECQCFHGHHPGANSEYGAELAEAPRLVFSPDGHRLASVGKDYTILIWGIKQPPGLGTLNKPLEPKEVQTLKADLFSDDAAAAYRAICKLRQVPEQAVLLATECLQPQTLTPDARKIVQEVNRCIDELDSDDFLIRTKAAEELRKLLSAELGAPVVQSILGRALLERKLSIEVKKSLTQLLDELKGERKLNGAMSPELTRMFREIEILERINNGPARELLAKLVEAPPRPEIRQEAEAALKRLTVFQLAPTP